MFVCVVLCVYFSVFVLFCFSCSQLCRMFLYRRIANITNITIHTTNKTCMFVCCLLVFVLFVFVLIVHVYVFVLFCFSCCQLCRMFLYRLITNITHVTKHKTINNYVFVDVCCLCWLCFVLCVHVSVFVLCCFFLFPTMPHVPL